MNNGLSHEVCHYVSFRTFIRCNVKPGIWCADMLAFLPEKSKVYEGLSMYIRFSVRTSGIIVFLQLRFMWYGLARTMPLQYCCRGIEVYRLFSYGLSMCEVSKHVASSCLSTNNDRSTISIWTVHLRRQNLMTHRIGPRLLTKNRILFSSKFVYTYTTIHVCVLP